MYIFYIILNKKSYSIKAGRNLKPEKDNLSEWVSCSVLSNEFKLTLDDNAVDGCNSFDYIIITVSLY